MHDRSLLGPADVDDDRLRGLVASALGHPVDEVEVLSSCAATVDYDLPAITTAGRYWVSGEAEVAGRTVPWRVFVKHVQCWSRSPFFADVPPEMRETARAGVPWRTEGLAYRSDLGDRLPDGLVMPRALEVFELDERSHAIWLEEVRHTEVPWDLERYRRAAHLLGRMAASPAVGELADVGHSEWTMDLYLHGRLAVQVFPLLRSDELWQHPVLAATFGDLRERLVAAADAAPSYVAELLALPRLAAHGDASPNNLLAGPEPDSFVLIDYGFWGPNPVGFDLGQLLVGDVQLGRRSTDLLAETDAALVPAYTAGLAEEGLDLDEDVVRRAHALQLLVFTGLSTLPFEHLGAPPEELAPIAAGRAAIARYVLDLVDATGG